MIESDESIKQDTNYGEINYSEDFLSLSNSINSIEMKESILLSSSSFIILKKLLSNIVDPHIHYLCPKCKNFPFIFIINENRINYNCECEERNNINLNIRTLFEKTEKYLIYDESNEIEGKTFGANSKNEDIFKCHMHKSEKIHKYKYYCKNCKINLCKDCFQIHLQKRHKLIIFDFNHLKTVQKISEIKTIINTKYNNIDKIEEKFENNNYIESYKLIEKTKEKMIKKQIINIDYFLKLIYIIFYDFYKFPNFSHFININFIYNFLIEQIKNCICKIIKNEKFCGIGFLCKIPLKKSEKELPLLITSSNIIGTKDIENKAKIQLKLVKGEELFLLNINEKSLYINEIEDITFIDIKKEGDLTKLYYLDIENNEDTINSYKGNTYQKIFLLHYLEDEVKFILINNDNNIDFASNEKNSFGEAIISLNYKIIGISNYKKYIKNNNNIILKPLIDEFKNLIKNNDDTQNKNQFIIKDNNKSNKKNTPIDIFSYNINNENIAINDNKNIEENNQNNTNTNNHIKENVDKYDNDLNKSNIINDKDKIHITKFNENNDISEFSNNLNNNFNIINESKNNMNINTSSITSSNTSSQTNINTDNIMNSIKKEINSNNNLSKTNSNININNQINNEYNFIRNDFSNNHVNDNFDNNNYEINDNYEIENYNFKSINDIMINKKNNNLSDSLIKIFLKKFKNFINSNKPNTNNFYNSFNNNLKDLSNNDIFNIINH